MAPKQHTNHAPNNFSRLDIIVIVVNVLVYNMVRRNSIVYWVITVIMSLILILGLQLFQRFYDCGRAMKQLQVVSEAFYMFNLE